MSDLRIIRGYPKNGWSQGVTWAIVERDDGHYVISHWAALWKGGTDQHGCFATDVDAEQWIRDHVKRKEEECLRKEQEKDLKEAKRLTEKWENIK
jgi:hypothetical protein